MYPKTFWLEYIKDKKEAHCSSSVLERSDLASKVLAEFPRVNLISILAGTLAFISVFLPWWGIDGSAYGFSASLNWSLWGRPYIGDPTSSTAVARATQTMGMFN